MNKAKTFNYLASPGAWLAFHNAINGELKTPEEVLERVRRQIAFSKEPQTELQLARRVVAYLKTFHRKLEFRYDYAGNDLTKAQAGQMKSINKRTGWPDLEVFLLSGDYVGLCIDLKKAGTKITREKDAKKKLIYNYLTVKNKRRGQDTKIPVREDKLRKAGDYWNKHIEEQAEAMEVLRRCKRIAGFAVGLEKTLLILEAYIHGDDKLLLSNLII